MQNHIISLPRTHLDQQAREYFLAISGFGRDTEKYQKRINQARALWDNIAESIRPKVILSRFDKEILQGAQLHIGEQTLSCTALSQLEAEYVEGIYLYILSVGDVYWNQPPTINMLYGEIWGTSYVDAAREQLQQILKEQEQARGAVAISDSFGPGFYGMPVTEVPKFFQILEADKIGVSLLNNALMLPIKTCAGIYVSVTKEGFLPGADCLSCLSQGSGCEFCQAHNRPQIQEAARQ